jgi:hypothetical protein
VRRSGRCQLPQQGDSLLLLVLLLLGLQVLLLLLCVLLPGLRNQLLLPLLLVRA